MKLKNKILITGHEGYIGNFLINFLKQKKIKYKKINLDKINNYNFKNYSHFIHLQFYIQNKKSNIKKNINNINKVIKICENNNLFLIFPSTASFKFKNKKRVKNNLNVINNYTFAKDYCEKKILLSNKINNLKFTIFRIFNVYGSSVNNRYYISTIIKEFINISDKIKIKYYKNIRDYIHIKDLSDLIYKSISKKSTGIFEVASGKSISIKNLATKIRNNYFPKKDLIFINPAKSKVNDYSKSNIKSTLKVFNWRPKISIENGLKKLILSTSLND
jgi:nucleoside-diphosphate-sugar epimerase|tara:strand:- start:126 stop:950 length:825 start_codon:yes stop_codon:yes gene_type:complete